MNLVLAAVLGYVVLQLGVGAWVARRTKSEDDYLLAGRKLGFGIATMTVFATWFGAETCIGAAGAVYERGLSGGRADPFGYALCVVFMGAFFATLFWRMRLTTIGDYYRRRYGPAAEKFAVLLMVPTSLLWAAAQIRAFGQVLSASSDLSVTITITVAAGVVIVYTMMGGLLADAITDVLQGGVLILGLAIVAAAVALSEYDGVAVAEALSEARLRLISPDDTIPMRIEAWAVPIMGSLFAQELVSRTLAARSARVAQGACLTAGGIYIAIGLVPVGLGLVGPAFVPDLEHAEQVLPALAQLHLPVVLYIIFAGALVSAILSTVDSALLACGSLVSHNVILPLAPNMDERKKVRMARIMVVVFGLIAYGMALIAEGVYALVEEASAFGSAGLFVAVVFGLATSRGGKLTGVATLGTGLASYVYFSLIVGSETPFLYSLGAAAGAWCLAAIFDGTGHRSDLIPAH